jgi:hypothetical protein
MLPDMAQPLGATPEKGGAEKVKKFKMQSLKYNKFYTSNVKNSSLIFFLRISV